MPAARHRRIAATCAAVLATGALAGCGGDGSDRSTGQITQTLRTALTTNDPATLCRRALSLAMVVRVYGDLRSCLAVEEQSRTERRAPSAVRVSQIKVDGDAATAVVALQGGDEGGARGALSLVRQDGVWRLDDLSTAFLRSEFNASLRGQGGLNATLEACLAKKVIGLPEPALRALAFGAMGGRPQAQEQLRGLVGECVGGLSAPSAGSAA